MPRAERPLDPDGGALAAFAGDLRQLRRTAGGPGYRRLATRAHFSSTTLADAASGQRLPTLEVTLAYVRACDGDEDAWAGRWHALAAELATANAHTSAAAGRDGDDDRGPYVGLSAFGPDDAGRFFGREQLTDELVARLRARRFVAVFGASGSGKSSLIRAGLLPRVTEMPTIVATPGPHPLEDLAAHLAAAGAGPVGVLVGQLRDDPRALHLAVLQVTASRPETDLLLVVDQFEEVFTLCRSPAERDRFITALITAAQAGNSRARVVIGIRADFYAACAEHPELVGALRDAQLLVGRMSTDELRRAVSRPAAGAGCVVESALQVRVVAEAAGRSGVLPLVSHAMRETWRRRRGNTLTLSGYEAAGGIHHALARTAEDVFGGLTAQQQDLTRRILLRLVALGEGTEDAKRRVDRDELAGPDVDTVLETLARARLVVLDTRTVEITHEALLQAWPRLRQWINDDRANLILGQQLHEAAAAWQREHRDPAALYRGNRLAAAREWIAERYDNLPPGSHLPAFLAASNRRERQTHRWRRAAVAGLCALTVLMSAAAVLAFQQRRSALTERDRAVAAQVSAEADAVGGTDPATAARLDLAAYRIRPTAATATALLATQNTVLSGVLTGGSEPLYAVAYSPDGRTLATGGGDNMIRLWNVADSAHPVPLGPPLRGHRGWVYWLQFSPDGRSLASASRDHTVRLWDVIDPAHPRPRGQPLSGHSSYVFSVSFSGDGRTLATASYDHTVRLWDVADPDRPLALGPPLTGHTDSVASAAFSPDGRTVASAGHDHTVRLWNVLDPRHPVLWAPPLAAHAGVVYAVAFSPDSRLLATVGDDRAVRLWNVADPRRPKPVGPPLTGHTDTILAVAFSPDGRVLATGGADHTIRRWDVSHPAHATPLGPPLIGHTGIVNWVAFSPGGHTLASVSDDHSARLWDLPRTSLTGHTGTVDAVAFDPSGRHLASGAADHTVRLWTMPGPGRPAVAGPSLTGPAGEVTRVTFSPDGKLLAADSTDGTVTLWNAVNPTGPVRLGRPIATGTTDADGLAFAPDGRTLATDGPANTVRLWDVRDPARPVPLGPPLTGHPGQISWTGFSPDGRTLATTDADDKVRRWDVTDPARPRPLDPIVTGDTDGISWAAFDPGGHTLATAGAGHAVQLWNLGGPGRPAVLGRPLTGHVDRLTWVGFSPDGRLLASTGMDGVALLWDVIDPARPVALGKPFTAGHVGPIDTGGFSPDGHTLVSAGDDHTISETGLDLDQAIDHLCASTANVMNAQQWHQYVPQAGFLAPCR